MVIEGGQKLSGGKVLLAIIGGFIKGDGSILLRNSHINC